MIPDTAIPDDESHDEDPARTAVTRDDDRRCVGATARILRGDRMSQREVWALHSFRFHDERKALKLVR